MIIAVIGNSLVFYITIRKRRRNAMEISIASMAASDLLFAAFLPIRILKIFIANWVFGELLCKTHYYVRSLSVLVSCSTMVFIAIDRYLVIKKPFQNNLSHESRTKNVFVFVILIWLMAAIFALPYAYFGTVTKDGDISTCHPFSVSGKMLLIICFLVIIVQFVIPITITSIVYCIICCYLLRLENVGEVIESQRSRFIASRKRMIKMLIIILLVFVICWLPTYLVVIIDVYYKIFNTSSHEIINMNVHVVTKFMGYLSICFNPFIYSWFNSDFWFEAKKFMRCICCK